jgi:PAS domain S-box-containing protein
MSPGRNENAGRLFTALAILFVVFALVSAVFCMLPVAVGIRVFALSVCAVALSYSFYYFMMRFSHPSHAIFGNCIQYKSRPAFILARSGEIVAANKEACTVFEEESTLADQTLLTEFGLLRENSDVAAVCQLVQSFSEDVEQRGTVKLDDKTSSVFEFVLHPCDCVSGNSDSFYLEFTNITPLVEMQTQLARRQQQYDMILNSLPMSFYYYRPGKEDIELWLSDKVETLSGYPASMFLEAPEKWYDNVHVNDVERVRYAKNHISETGNYSMEYKWMVADGSYRWFRDEAVYVENGPDGVAEVAGICRDITEEKQASDCLHLTNSFITNNSFALICFSVKNHFRFVNDAALELFGYSKADFMQLAPEQLFENDHQTWENLLTALCSQQGNSKEWMLRRSDNELFPADLSASYIDLNGVGHIFCDIRDISVQKELEGELLKSQKLDAMSTLAGGLAHDYNNILSAIFGYTQLVRMNFENRAKQERALDGIYKATSRAKELVQQILTFSRKSRNEKTVMQISVLAKEVMKFMRRSIPASIEIDVSIETESLVYMNPSEIHQVYVNLCINGAEAIGEENGTIYSRLSDVVVEPGITEYENIPPGKYVCIEIRDNGAGMPEQVLDCIFDPYFSTQQKAEGRGLGLAVVHGIITDHQGYMKVHSVPEKGTTFRAYLPVCERDTRDEKEPETEPEKLLGYEHVLFVDDDLAIVNVTSRVMQRNGYKVTTCTDGQEALDCFLAHRDELDIVVTDMTMPKLSGIELADAIHKERPELPIILCTGHRENITAEDLEAGGVQELVEKPYHIKNLILTMRNCLGQVEEDE